MVLLSCWTSEYGTTSVAPPLPCCVVCLQHPWLTTDASARQIHSNPAKAAALGAHMVRRLKGFAKLSHMKRLALVLMARTLTDRDVARLRVRPSCWTKEHGYSYVAPHENRHVYVTYISPVLAVSPTKAG